MTRAIFMQARRCGRFVCGETRLGDYIAVLVSIATLAGIVAWT